MRRLLYSINITLDGCGDHEAGVPDEDTHQHAADAVGSSDLLFGRKTYELMEFWRPLAVPGAAVPEGMEPWMMDFAGVIDPAKKYLVSRTRTNPDWNTTLLRCGSDAELAQAVNALKRQDGKPLLTGGIHLALKLAELGLIDEYEFIVQPRLAGHGPYVFAGLSRHQELELVGRKDFKSGAVALKYVPKAA